MSNIVDRVFNEVCLDERISDGIFRLEEEEHMNALRDYFIKKGITREAAIHVTNRMVEGKYPDRQAWRVEDGILVTWPSPKHMAIALAKPENKGKYTNKDPRPEKEKPVEKELDGEKPEPEIDGDEEDSGDDEDIKPEPTIFQGDKQLSVEPPGGAPVAPAPAAPTTPIAPRTPERIAAEKEVVNQIMNTDDNVLSDIVPQVNEVCKHQLNELYKKADEWGFREAITFLTPYVKS